MKEITVPLHRLPPGYEKALRNPRVPPVEPRPAATLFLLREGAGGMEILLLKRNPRARFIPGAYVFPGGRLDEEDASLEMAALRETLEETGILVGAGPGGAGTLNLNDHPRADGILPALRGGTLGFTQVLERLGRPRLPQKLPLIGHWVTPVQERYRYDTLFFGAQVPEDTPAIPDGSELVEGLWITPAEALERNRAGELPMVFPTLGTLEALVPYEDPAEALETLSKREIPRLLPTVEETGEGVRMRV